MSHQESYHTVLEAPDFPEIPEDYLPRNARIHFAFGGHEGAEDLGHALPHIVESDIVIPEFAGWTPDHVSWFRSVSRSKEHNFQKLLRHRTVRGLNVEHPYFFSLISTLQGKNKTVLFADASSTEEFSDPQEERIKNATLDEYLGGMHRYLVALAASSNDRDPIIIRNLGPFITKAITDHPRLREQPEVPTLVILGLHHDRVYRHLDESPVSDQISASYDARVYQRAINQNLIAAHDEVRESKPISRRALLEVFIGERISQILDMDIGADGLIDGDDRAEAEDALFRRLAMLGDTTLEGVLLSSLPKASSQEAR
jgi:hypothetical protein